MGYWLSVPLIAPIFGAQGINQLLT